MQFFSMFFLCFTLIFLSELGDKTQILVLSFSTKNKTKNVLLGIAIGTFFSHGLAILFGSKISEFATPTISYFLNLFTYLSFIFFGIFGIISKNYSKDSLSCNKEGLLQKILSLKLNYVLIIAINIIIGEFGDKTFLASLGLGIQYPDFKLPLILGSIFGMVCSNLIAIVFGKFLSSKFKQDVIENVSNVLFILFGIGGLVFELLF